MSATAAWRPIHRSLPDEAVALVTEQSRLADRQPRTALRPMPVHLALVTDDEPQQFRTACGGGLGQWITGSGAQVTCPGCLETVHA